jgi:hypothetical protein
MRPPPSVLDRAAGVGLDSGVVRDLWTSFSTAPEDEGALADRLEEAVFPLNDAAEVLRREATTELQRREDAWRPRARRLGEWLPRARRSQEETNVVPGLRAAQDWLGGTAGAIRDERFAPIAAQATAIWRMLRQQSSVELGAIRLEGKGTQRRVSLDVSIDGVDGAALGVMSQGELHSMALSLFLPRAMLHESPFRFIFIDDPVQSMDPARVDGLAEVLASAATTHQIVVFTHDDRLPEATRRLGFAATIIAVARREGSVVELREELDPAKRHLKDAFDLAKTGDMPPKVAMRVVPGFCRAAIEAACFEVVRRRRIGVGSPHAEVENALVAVTKLTTALALALFDDASRGGDVLPRINSSFGKRAGDVFVACNRGAHQGYSGRLLDLARDSEYLVERIRSLK